MKKLLLATTAALGLVVSAGAANATLTYTIWSGNGLSHGATFPVPTTDLIASFTSTTPIDFTNDNPDGGSNTLGDFFNGAPGPNPVPLVSTPPLTSAQLATVMSTADAGSDLSTFIRITETYDLTAPFTGSISHDDGALIVIDGDSSTGIGSTVICGAPGEASENTEACDFTQLGFHTLTLLYTEDNGSPAILVADIPPESAIPEPASMALLGSGLLGLSVLRRRRRNNG